MGGYFCYHWKHPWSVTGNNMSEIADATASKCSVHTSSSMLRGRAGSPSTVDHTVQQSTGLKACIGVHSYSSWWWWWWTWFWKGSFCFAVQNRDALNLKLARGWSTVVPFFMDDDDAVRNIRHSHLRLQPSIVLHDYIAFRCCRQ